MEEEELINIDDSPQAKLKLNAYLQNNGKLKKDVDPKYNKIKLSTSQYLHNNSIGKSDYDKNLNFGDLDQQDIEKSINENRANEQSGWTQLGALPFRATAKAATEVAKLAPIIYGVGKAIFEDNETSTLEDIFNNEGIKALDEMNQKINTELLPVYVKDSVKNGTLMDNLLSTSFYATEGADGIGFMASMFVPGMILSKFSLGSKLIGGLSKVSKLTKMVEGTEGSVQVLKGLGWSARAIDSKIAVLTNSMIESGAESKGTQDALNSERLNEIELYKSKGLSQEQAEEVFNQKHPDWDNQVASAMKGDFWMQMPMLLGTGSIMHKAIFGKALDKVEKTVEYGLKGRVGSMAKQWGKALVTEGNEEAVQSTLENYYTKKAYEGKLGKGLIGDVNIGDLTKEYINTVSSVEGQKAIFLGALMGGPFMSMEARKEYLKGLKDTNSITNGVKSSIDDYNTIKENDIYEKDPNDSTKPLFKRDENGNITSEKVVNREKALEVAKSLKNIEDDDALYDEAIKSDDVELQKFIQNRNILKLIAPAIQNGKLGLQILKEELEQTLKFTDISEADKNSKDENNTNKKLVETILAKAEHLQKQNEKFKDFSPDIIKLDDPRTTKELNEEYLNHLNSKYIETKSLQYDSENKLKDLIKKRSDILEEIGLDKNLQTEDEILVNKEKTSPLLNQTNNQIRQTEKEITKYKKDINDLWDNKSLVNTSFKQYLDNKDEISNKLSDENERKHQDIIDKINNATTKEDLKGIKSDNPIIKEKLAAKQKILKELEDEQKAIQLANQSIAQQQHEDTTVSTADKTIPAINTAAPLTHNTEGAENHDELKETEGKNQDNEEIHPLLGHAKLISTDRDSGEKLPFIQQQFIDYERNPINKVGNEVSVRINEDFGKSKELAKAIAILKSKDFTPENIQFLINYLPFNIHISDNVFAPMETQPKGAKEQEVFNDSSKILRTLIVNELVKGTDINDIKLTILGQFQGALKIDKNVPENSILELDAVQKKLIDINDNIFMVNSQNDKQFADGRVEAFPVNTDLGRVRGVGEIYLNIPQANGKPYSMKLNIRKVNKEEASVIADIFEYRMTHKVGKATLLVNLPKELQDKINSLEAIIKVLTSKGKQAKDLTIKDVVDFMIWDLSSNKKSQVKLSGTGVVGETVLKYGDTVITKLDSSSKDKFINWLTENKRHNIKFKAKKNESKQDKLDINDKVYLEYLLSSKTLNTNAVVNEPTFQGYANIYLENNISVKGNKTQGKEGSFSKPKNEPRKTTKTTKEEIATVQETVNPITNDYSAYNKATDGINFYSAIVDGEQYYASVTSLRVFKDKGVNTDELKRAPKPEELYGELITDNNIINQVQEFIRTDDEMFANPNLILNNYENIRNSENNSVSLHEIPNTVESKQLEVVQKSNDTFSKLSTKKQGELLNLLKTKLKEKVSLLKDKQYLSIAKENNSQKLYEYLTKLAKDNDLDIKDIEKHCK